MSLDLAFDDAQQAIADTLAQWCGQHCSDDALRQLGGDLPDGLWGRIAELGVLGIATAEGEGGPLELCAALEALGYGVCPGPWIGGVLAGQLLEGAELRAVVEGRTLVAVGEDSLFAWGARAQLFFARRGDAVHRATPTAALEPIEMLGGEAWGRVPVELGPELTGSLRACCLADMAHAAYLSSASLRLLDAACEHARTRKQFGRSIGEFQAVAHPLADCSMSLSAARALTRAGACALQTGDLDLARTRVAAARLSAASAARNGVHVCHQVFGASGISLEGPAFAISRRIQQLVASPGEGRLRERVLQSFARDSARVGSAP